VAVSPSNGAGQKLPDWFVKMLAGKDVIVISDRDVPGEKAGKAWAQQSAAVAKSVKLVELPYDLAETHGKDLRDFLEDHPGKLDTYIDNTEPFQAELTAAGDVAAADLVEDDEKAYKALQIDVVSRLNSNGAVLYCRSSKVTQDLGSIDNLTLANLITLCGASATNFVKDRGESADHKISVNQVKNFLANEISKSTEDAKVCGAGLWQADDGSPVLVNGTHVLIFRDDEVVRIEDGTYRNLRFLYDRRDWFDPDLLQSHYKAAEEPEWRKSVVAELYEFVDRWTWEHKNCQYLVAGLILATMVQSTLPWRPLVSLIGSSDSGKTVFAIFLAGLLGKNFSAYTDEATKAGLLNNLKHKSPFTIHDEWDNAPHRNREGILQMIRSSSRSASEGIQKQVFKSDTRQRAIKSEFLPLIFWAIGINNDIESTPDKNRMIEIRLNSPERGGAKDLYFREKDIKRICQSGEFSADIGLKLLAIATRTLPSILRLYSPASRIRMEGVPSRIIESWAVPAAALAAAWGFGEDEIEGILDRFKEIYWKDESIESKDEAIGILEDLFAMQVRLSTNQTKTLSSIIQDSQSIEQNRDDIESFGITFLDRDGKKFVCVSGGHLAKKKVCTKSSRSINQILSRLDGAERDRFQLNGAQVRGVFVPIEIVRSIIPNVCWNPTGGF
jgi:hypothetical protein